MDRSLPSSSAAIKVIQECLVYLLVDVAGIRISVEEGNTPEGASFFIGLWTVIPSFAPVNNTAWPDLNRDDECSRVSFNVV